MPIAASGSGSGASPRIDLLVGAAILALAAFLRLYYIGHQPLWLDEGYSWWDARQSLEDLWRLVPQCDPHPPLYAALLKGWTAVFGDSATAMRGFGAALGVAATAVVMLAGYEINRRVAWIAGVLFAVAPFQIEHAHEARPYALLALGAALVLFGALRILRSPVASARIRLGWLALIGGAVIALWANNTSVFLLAALGVFGTGLILTDASARPLARPMLIAAAAIVLMWLPYVPTYLEQARGISADFWIPPTDAWRVGNELRYVVGLGSFTVLWLVATLGAIGIAVLWRRGSRREAALIAALVVLPPLFNYVVSITVKPIFLARALIGIAPAFALAVALALSAVRPRTLGFAAVGALAAARIASAAHLYVDEHRKEPWDDIAQVLTRDARGDTLVLLVPNELALPLGHALNAAHANLALRGVPAEFPAPGLRARYPSGKCTPSVVGQSLAPLAQAVRGRHTVLVVTRRNNAYDPRNETQALLRSLDMQETAMHEFWPGAILVQKFVAPPTLSAGTAASHWP